MRARPPIELLGIDNDDWPKTFRQDCGPDLEALDEFLGIDDERAVLAVRRALMAAFGHGMKYGQVELFAQLLERGLIGAGSRLEPEVNIISQDELLEQYDRGDFDDVLGHGD